jgi:hypothetical protein
VSILNAADIIEVDRIYLAGTATGGNDLEVTQTLENASLYAFHAELTAGTLYLPILFDGARARSIVPTAADNPDIADGVATGFTQVDTEDADAGHCWQITTPGIYRIIVDLDAKTITIHSPATDPQSKVVSWNNTVLGINPYSEAITKLYMYGTFNGFAKDADLTTGFQEQYTLKQSLANPMVFVYQGDVLPRGTGNDERGNAQTGSLRFAVSAINNNVYAFGSTASAKRNQYNGYVTVTDNAPQGLVAGQSDNRYAYFLIPENVNFVVVDIEKLTVVFDNK